MTVALLSDRRAAVILRPKSARTILTNSFRYLQLQFHSLTNQMRVPDAEELIVGYITVKCLYDH